MPIDYSKYPPNWKTEIRPRILARANNRCEKCGAVNYSVVKRNSEGQWMTPSQQEWDMVHSRIKYSHSNMSESLKYHGFVKIVLTIAHLDHDEENHEVSDDRLQALCQRCHLKYDAKEKARRKKHKQLKNQLHLWQQ